MGTSSGSQNTTTRAEPPAYLQPYLQNAAASAQALFQGGGPRQFQGNTVTPFSDQTQQALNMATQRAIQGSPVNAAAQQNAVDTLSGSFFDQNNPFVQNQIQNAIDPVRRNLDSVFARSGRDLEAQAPVLQEAASDIASNFAFQNFNAERGRQLQAQALAPTLANTDFQDINALAGVGSQVEGLSDAIIQDRVNRFNFDETQPDRNLDAFLQRLGVSTSLGGGTTSQTTPVTRNRTAGALGGALGGGALGSLFANAPIAAAIPGGPIAAGAALGGLLGLL